MKTNQHLLLVVGLSGLFPLLSFCGLEQQRDPDKPPEGLSGGDWSSIRAAYEAGRHQFFQQADGSHTARNPGLGWRMSFDEAGFTATPEDGSWSWGLELEVGRCVLTAPPSGQTTTSLSQQEQSHLAFGDGAWRTKRPTLPCGGRAITGTTIAFPRTPHLTEWFINDARGLE